MKYNVFKRGYEKRIEKQSQQTYLCDICVKTCKSQIGVNQHQRVNGCEKYLSVKNNLQF